MRVLYLIIILILSQILWMGLIRQKDIEEPELGNRDLRFTLQSVRCLDPINYGDDDVRIDIFVPGREPVTFKKTMAHKGSTKHWVLNEPFYFSEDSVVLLKLWVQSPKQRTDTLGSARIGKIVKNGSCTNDLEFKGDNFRYEVKYSLEGAEAIENKSPTGTETTKGCGRIL